MGLYTPVSKNSFNTLELVERKRMRKATKGGTVRGKLMKENSCQICQQVMTLPVTTPCAHNSCKACLEAKFAGTTHMRESRGGRTLRTRKNVMKCPCCPSDISDFLQNPQVNRDVMEVIEKLKNKEEENVETVEASNKDGEGSGTDEMEENTETESEENEGTDPREETLVMHKEAE